VLEPFVISKRSKARLHLHEGELEVNGSLNDRVYEALREAVICGRFAPEKPVALRPLAAELGVSPMPVREAISRLLSEQALIQSGRGIVVPPMTADRFKDLVDLRMAIEPNLSERVIHNIRPHDLKTIKAHNDALDGAMSRGDVEGYILFNYLFHRAIYSLSQSTVLNPILDRVWLQLGPFSRVLYGRLGTATLSDKHVLALDALDRRDPAGLAEALRQDIRDGLVLIQGDLTFFGGPENRKTQALSKASNLAG
jgi:DNA-binding GntR family transcriptional regulator